MGISKIKPLASQYHSVGGSRGRGLLCLAPQLVYYFICSIIHSITHLVQNVSAGARELEAPRVSPFRWGMGLGRGRAPSPENF